jgi:flagellum-specific peptidoglycan hydrolase FlgJ
MYITIVKIKNKLKIYKKYFKGYDSVNSNFNDYFQFINNSSKYIFESNDVSDELERLKFLNKTKSNIGIET